MFKPSAPAAMATISETLKERQAFIDLLNSLAAQLPEARVSTFKQIMLFIRQHKDYDLLSLVLAKLNEAKFEGQSQLRQEAIAAILEFANEQNAKFSQLIQKLKSSEQIFILAAFFESIRQDSDPENRLLRLRSLVEATPEEVRGFYWPEAEKLAHLGGDDAKLSLIGLAKTLNQDAKEIALKDLKAIVKKVNEPFKRSMAVAVLSSLGALISEQDRTEAQNAAYLIPNQTLRALSLSQLNLITLQETQTPNKDL
jgi:hypothetical protein